MTDLQVTAALAGSAAAAVSAPSLAALGHQGESSWRWVVHSSSLDLYAARALAVHHGRHGDEVGREDRRILINCGSALHRARVALAADGFSSETKLLPDNEPGHVATLTPTGPARVTDEARRRFAATETADSREVRPPSPRPVPTGAVDALIDAASAEGVQVRVLAPAEVKGLASSTPVTRAVSERLDRFDPAVYGLLYGQSAAPEAWLRAGEALSAIWLEAARRGLSISPSSSVVELRGGRDFVRDLLPQHATPYLAVRVD